MSTIYLINQQPLEASERHGDYIIEAWNSKRMAELRVTELKKLDGSYEYFVQEVGINERS